MACRTLWVEEGRQEEDGAEEEHPGDHVPLDMLLSLYRASRGGCIVTVPMRKPWVLWLSTQFIKQKWWWRRMMITCPLDWQMKEVCPVLTALRWRTKRKRDITFKCDWLKWVEHWHSATLHGRLFHHSRVTCS